MALNITREDTEQIEATFSAMPVGTVFVDSANDVFMKIANEATPILSLDDGEVYAANSRNGKPLRVVCAELIIKRRTGDTYR